MSDQKTDKELLEELRALQLDFQALQSTHEANISEHQQVVEKLKNNETLLKKAEEIAKFGNWQVFLEDSRLTFSEGAARIYGLKRLEATLDQIKKIAVPKYRAMLDDALGNLIQHGTPYNVEYKINRVTDGEIIDIHSVAEYDSEKNILFGTIHDITEQKRIEKILAKSEEQYRSLYANMIEGSALHTLIFDKDGVPEDYRIVEVNPAFESQLGITRADVIKKASKEAFGVETPPYLEVYSRVALTGQHEIFETYFAPLDKYFCISVYCPYKGSFATIFEDITVRKQAELKLIESEGKLKELNATKDKFFSIIAHDLKTPFNGILGFSEMLKNEVRNLDNDSIEKYVDIIHSTALQAYGLLENLLEWSKTQQNGLIFVPRKLLLRNLVADEMAGLKLNADQKDISLLNETDEEILLTADEKMLRTVVRNLISNALKFTPKGGIVRVEAHLTPDYVEVMIVDSGVGMNSDTLDKLFKIESSFSTRGTENERGTGLGLLLCKEFVEKHGGKIWGISEKGKGSIFKFSIPLTPTKKGSKP